MQGKNKISAIVLTFNEERQIRDCLDSIKWVDEIIVVDSLSTDKTIDICREYTDKIYQRKYQRYARTRNWSFQFASYNWILAVDADERYTSDLAKEIRERLAEDTGINGYFSPIKYYCFGRELKNWRKGEKRLRLFKKGSVRLQEREVHPQTIVTGKKGVLQNPISHYPYPNLRVFFDKFGRYTKWDAEEKLKERPVLRIFDPILTLFKPGYYFIDYYFRHSVYKDGIAGFLMSFLMSFYTFFVDINYYCLIITKGFQYRWMSR
jgi:glycosyltransferase involved in cell wall biosynthesis